MNATQEKWLFEHLGHTENVHMLHYRARSSVIERVEIAKLCLMQDSNNVKQFVGKPLDEIDIADLVYPEGEGEKVKEVQRRREKALSDVEKNAGEEGDDGIYEEIELFGNESDDDEDKEPKNPKIKKKAPALQQRKTSVREKYSADEVAEINRYFAHFLKERKCPRAKDCEKARQLSKKNGGMLWKKKRDNIKKEVNFMNYKAKKKEGAQ